MDDNNDDDDDDDDSCVREILKWSETCTSIIKC